MHVVRRSHLRRSLALAAGVLAVLLGTTAPASAAGTGSGQEVVGTVLRAYVEHRDQQDAAAGTDAGAPLTWITSTDGSSIRVPTGSLADVPVGSTVAVKVGAQIVDAAASADHLEPAQQVLASSVVATAPTISTGTAAAAPAVTDTVSIAMVTPVGSTADGTSLATLVSQVDGPVAQFWATQSRGAMQLGVADTHDWGSVPVTADCSDPITLWNQAAADIGFAPGPGKHLLLYVPNADTQCADGLAEVGSSLHAGGYLYVRDTLTSVIAHEFGHNFGLLHSGSEECQGAVEAGNCDVQEYGDIYDVMGASWQQVGSLNAVQAARLGFLPSPQVQAVPASGPGGTYTLAPLSASSGTRAIQLMDDDGTTYYLEYRAGSGQDAYLGTAADLYGLESGVLLHRVMQTNTADSSMLLDGTPSSGSGYASDDADAFPVGSGVLAAGGQFVITVRGLSTTGASVTVTPAVNPISALYTALGGASGSLGTALAPQFCGLAGAGCARAFQRGLIYWSAASGAHVVAGDVGAAWLRRAGPSGALGYPVGEVLCGLAGGGCRQVFQGGSLYWSPSSGSAYTFGNVEAAWESTGTQDGPLGYPVADVACGLAQGGCAQPFQRGWLFWSAATGAHTIAGDVGAGYLARSAQNGVLGYPVGEVLCGLAGGGCRQVFQGGSLYWSAGSGAGYTTGNIEAAWESTGTQDGPLGYPVADVACGLVGGGCWQPFQRGIMYWSPASGGHAVMGDLGAAWLNAGAQNSTLGYPVGNLLCALRDGGCLQQFQHARMYWTPATGADWFRSEIITGYEAANAQDGALGYPTDDEICGLRNGGCFTTFQGGSVYWSPTTGSHAITGAIADAWTTQDGPNGSLGYPTSDATTSGTVTTQHFQGGTLTASVSGVART